MNTTEAFEAEEPARRQALIDRLYERNKRDYRDATRYTTCTALRSRVATLGVKMKKVPLAKRTSTNALYKRDALERRLLQWKLHVYEAAMDTARQPTLPMEVTLWHWDLQLTDRQPSDRGLTQAERQWAKDEHMKRLLHISLLRTDLAEVQRLVEAAEAGAAGQ